MRPRTTPSWGALGPRAGPRRRRPRPDTRRPPALRPHAAADGPDPAARGRRTGPLPLGGVAGGGPARGSRRAVLPRDADPTPGAGGAADRPRRGPAGRGPAAGARPGPADALPRLGPGPPSPAPT